MLMDTPQTQLWRGLSVDREYWKASMRAMKKPRVMVEVRGSHFEEGETLTFTSKYKLTGIESPPCYKTKKEVSVCSAQQHRAVMSHRSSHIMS